MTTSYSPDSDQSEETIIGTTTDPAPIDQLKALLDRVELTYVELTDGNGHPGVGVGFGESGYAVLALLGTQQDAVLITSGVLQDAWRDRLTLLSFCNAQTRRLPSFPVFLHEGPSGWDLLVQVCYSLRLLVANPDLFRECIVRAVSVADTLRRREAENLGGTHYQFSGWDAARLLARGLQA